MNLVTKTKKEVKESWMKTFPIQAFLFLFLVGAVILQLGISLWNYFFSNFKSIPNILGPFIIIIITILGVLYVARLVLGFVPLDHPKDFLILIMVIIAIVLAFVYLEKIAPFIFSATPINSVINLIG